MARLDSQSLAVRSQRSNLLVVAPPGCGKTEMLARRADELIGRLGPNQRILALTFTKRARANLGERLRHHLGRDRFRRYVTVHNFHGHAAEMILAHGRTLRLPVDELVMPTSKTLKIALQQLSRDAVANAAAAKLLGEVKRQCLSDEEILDALDAAGDRLAKRVELARIAANELHYEDLLRHGQRLLAIGEVAHLYNQHYGAVLVDEFQDLSTQQLEIATSSCTTWRTFAGDPLQGIFSWAGAQPEVVETTLRALCGEPIKLSVSYRSSPAVLAMLNGVATRLGAVTLRSFKPPAWPDGGASSTLVLDNLDDEAEFITRTCKQILGSNSMSSIGIISRSGWRRQRIDRAIGESDLSCRRWDLAIEDPGILDAIASAASTMSPNTTIQHAREKVIQAIDPSDVDSIEQMNEAFDELATSAVGSIHEALKLFTSPAKDEAVAPGVHLLNAHTGKGQQFDWVFIPGLEENHIPDKRNNSGDALAEEERVLLVMLSRAKHGVIATAAKTLDGMYGPYQSKPSRWWSGLKSTATMDFAQLQSHLDAMYSPSEKQLGSFNDQPPSSPTA